MKLNKKEQMVVAGIRILSVTIEDHVGGWEKEFKENNGYLKANVKINMYSVRKALRELKEQFAWVDINPSWGNSFVQECKDFQRVLKNRRNIDIEKIVRNEMQGRLPYDDFITHFYIFGVVLDWMMEHYGQTIDRIGIKDKIDKVVRNYRLYGKVFEKEIVIVGV